MPPELALVESRALRASVAHRVNALDKVKALIMLPDGSYVTTAMVAAYFEVPETTIKNLTQRHRAELEANGFRILKGVDMSRFVGLNMSPTQVSGRGIAIYERRTVLNVAMLLRDSAVARQVRTYLLDVEERVVHSPATAPQAPPQPQPQPQGNGMPPGRRLGPGPHWDEWEVTSRNPAAEAWRQVIDGETPTPTPAPTGWAESLDRRLDSMGRVGSALSRKFDELAEDIRDLRGDVQDLGRGRRRRP